MELSDQILKVFEELVILNNKMLSLWNILDKDNITRIENYKKFYENNIKPSLGDYRKESKVIEGQMRIAESFISTLYNKF